jgi:2-phospho-L-lactate guanylyltransferase (CobY/MobA/RfbA family)
VNRLIYVETSIPSFYHETRPGAQMQARREWTREWWQAARLTENLVSSVAVIEELSRTPEPKRTELLTLMEDIPHLPITQEVREIVHVYVRHKIMPADTGGDALHLALATFHQCDILVSWNCRHIANASKAGHIRNINNSLHLATPDLITPYELLEIDA